MPDLDQGRSIPARIKTRYVEIDDGVWAQVVAAILVSEDMDGTESQTLLVDEITGALSVIDVPHHEIHEGEMFHVSNLDLALADDATIVLGITVGARFPHLTIGAAGGGDAQIELRENAVITGGTNPNVRNRKRTEGDGGDTATVVLNPVVNAPGILLENVLLPGGTGGNAVGATAQGRPEWILAPGRVYIVRFTNRAGNAQPANLRIDWYEEGHN